MDKEQLISRLVYTAVESIGLSSGQGEKLRRIMEQGFDGVDFIPEKDLPATEIFSNEVLIKNFVGCKKLAGVKDSSIKAYLFVINKFLNYKALSLAKATTDDIRRFLLDYESTASNKTVDNARRYLNTFFTFMEDEGYIEKNPCRKIKQIKQPQQIRRFYTDLEIEKMRDACQDKRELAIIDLLISTGLRVSEVASIMLTDIDWEERTIKITGKGDKQRVVPFSERCKKHLREYIAEGKTDNIHLFCQDRRPYKEISKNGIQRVVGRIGDRIGLEDITVHCFRRYFATDLCKKGVEPQVLQDILGHSSYQTTSTYYLQTNITKARYIHAIYAN